jgi:uncharacterized protein YbjT (DUF2867 family)
VLRAAQFHEFVEQLVQWGTQGDVSYVPRMRTQLVAARTVAEALAELTVAPESAPGPTLEVAGPREESLVEMAKMLVARRGDPLRIEPVSVLPSVHLIQPRGRGRSAACLSAWCRCSRGAAECSERSPATRRLRPDAAPLARR